MEAGQPNASGQRMRERSRSRHGIEPFAGNSYKWPNFKSKLIQFYHENKFMTALKKFIKLDECIVHDSEPYETISGYDRTPEYYHAAWDDLCARYDNKRKLVEECISRFIDIPSSRFQSRSGITGLINAINHLVKTLPRFNVDVNSWGPMLVILAQRKMDNRTLNSWLKARSPREIPTLEPLLKFFEREADSMDGRSNENVNKTDTTN